ncbi:MAG: hypothetical protein JWQ66_950 [Mucilaginibacter sp.]|nr:hypothetical protein [Mucilaginibacter sp.]
MKKIFEFLIISNLLPADFHSSAEANGNDSKIHCRLIYGTGKCK